jgi:hypothetical protein
VNVRKETQPIALRVSEKRKKNRMRLTPAKLGYSTSGSGSWVLTGLIVSRQI